jgi:hypothetical protein
MFTQEFCLLGYEAVQRITRSYIPHDTTLDNHHCENLKFYKQVYGYKISLDDYQNNLFIKQ